MSPASTVHAAAVLVGERAVLIRGAPGSGKSALVLALLAADPERSALIADDRVFLTAANRRLIASTPAEIAGLIEIRGQGIFHRPHVSPAVIDLVVDLLPTADCPRLPEAAGERVVIGGVALPRLRLPIGAGDGGIRVKAALDFARA